MSVVSDCFSITTTLFYWILEDIASIHKDIVIAHQSLIYKIIRDMTGVRTSFFEVVGSAFMSFVAAERMFKARVCKRNPLEDIDRDFRRCRVVGL